MGTFVALYKPFDLSLQNLIKYKYLLYISFLFGLVSIVPFYSRKKKGNEKVGREKRKKDQMYQLRYLLLACCSPLNWCFFFVVCFVSFLFCSFSFNCHFLLVFNLLFVKINKKTLGCLMWEGKQVPCETFNSQMMMMIMKMMTMMKMMTTSLHATK